MSVKNKYDFLYYQYIPQIYILLALNLAFFMFLFNSPFSLLFNNNDISIFLSIITALVIIVLAIIGTRYNVKKALSLAEKRENFYIVNDPIYDNKVLPEYNACVPFVPGLSVIVVSRSLVDVLSDDELKAIIKHEEGHIKYNHVTIGYLVVAAFYLLFGEISRISQDIIKFLGNYWYIILFAIMYGLALIIINTVLRGLESEADTYAVLNGYGELVKSALSKIPERGGLRIFDPHPLREARPAKVPVDSLAWNLRVLFVPLIMLSSAFSIFITAKVSGELHVVLPLSLVLGLVVFISSFIFLLVITYIMMLMYKAVGFEPYESRVIILMYYVLTLTALLVIPKPSETAYLIANMVSALVSPITIYRGVRAYLRALIPFALIWALNVAALVILAHAPFRGFLP